MVFKERSDTSIKFKGKVYGPDKVYIDIEKDKEGVLELSKRLMKKLGQMDKGVLVIPMSYELVRK